MRFAPRHCPHSDCSSSSEQGFRWRRKGSFQRRCDGRRVQRFLCLSCRRFFSTQSFRLDYRLRKPALSRVVFRDFVSKVTQRQSARTLRCSRRTIAHRLLLLGEHCQRFHQQQLDGAASRGGIAGVFQLDELETFEHSRRLCPVSVPVLVEQRTFFVVDVETAALPARGKLKPADVERKRKREVVEGVRRSESTLAVRRSFQRLAVWHSRDRLVRVVTDRKTSYPTALERAFGAGVAHQRASSKTRRDRKNPLFAINHTLAMLRDGMSRLVRRSWAASKKRARLARHLWIWVAYRNYVRGITNKAPRITPAQALGVIDRQLKREELLAWKVFARRA